jgi:hypothetical protein
MPAETILTAPLADSPRRATWLRRVVGGFGLLLVAATWRLWTPQTVFPQVPMFRPLASLPPAADWLFAGTLLAALAAVLLLPDGRTARWSMGVLAASLAALFALDQQRMQPWAYLFVLLAVILSSCPPQAALRLARVLIVAFYFESALTKLDHSFLHTLGQQFLETLLGLAGIDAERLMPGTRLALAAVFPVGEMLVAVGLFFERTRRVALVGAILLHALLLVILGPWGLGHKPGVLLWNVYFIVQDLVLFGLKTAREEEAVPQARESMSRFALVLVVAAIGLPLLEPWGWFDTWPSWGLYASSAERVVLQVHRVAESDLPPALAPFIQESPEGDRAWLNVRLDRWALETLGAPIYPQARVQLGAAIAVAEGAGLAQRARIIRFDKADRWTGERQYTVLSGIGQAHAAADEYWLNARPRRPFR